MNLDQIDQSVRALGFNLDPYIESFDTETSSCRNYSKENEEYMFLLRVEKTDQRISIISDLFIGVDSPDPRYESSNFLVGSRDDWSALVLTDLKEKLRIADEYTKRAEDTLSLNNTSDDDESSLSSND